jgi:predicted Fe-Mo cluster-binding NifX family protein
MRIAIPIWEERVSPVLDSALNLMIVEVNDHKETSRFMYPLDEHDLSRRCLRIKELDVNTLICGAVSSPFQRMLQASGIDVIQEISGVVEDVLTAYLQGNLFCSKFMLPWCKRKRLQGHRKRRQYIQAKKEDSQ